MRRVAWSLACLGGALAILAPYSDAIAEAFRIFLIAGMIALLAVAAIYEGTPLFLWSDSVSTPHSKWPTVRKWLAWAAMLIVVVLAILARDQEVAAYVLRVVLIGLFITAMALWGREVWED